MTMPVGLQTVTVSATFLSPTGVPRVGYVDFTPEPATLTSTSANVLLTGTTRMTLDGSGSGSVVLLATDSTGVTPSGWTYRVTERLVGGSDRDYAISLPAAAPAVQLADIAPTAPAAGEYVVVTGPPGPPGPVSDFVRPSFSGARVALTGYPENGGSYEDVAPFPADVWRFMPLTTDEELAFTYLALLVSPVASGGTAAAKLALFATTSDGLPGAVELVWPGTVDLTGPASEVVLVVAGHPIPAGDWFIGVAWAGTATGAPSLGVSYGGHPRVAPIGGAGLNRGAYAQFVSGAAAPNPAAPTGTGLALLVWGVVG